MHSALRRILLATVATIAVGSAAHADTFPSKPVTLVVTQGPGSGSDITARLVAGYLAPLLGQPVIVNNRTGASGIIGHQSVLHSPADGYTLLFSSTAALFVVPTMNANANYTVADFVTVAPVLRAPFVVLVAESPQAPKTMAELIARLRARPESYASAGIGTMTHLGSELILRKAGVEAVHVPYKGSGAALTDLIGGQVLFATDSLVAATPLIHSGKLRALAVTGSDREPTLPNVPTLAQAGLPNIHVASVSGLFAPKGTAREAVDKVAAATAQVLRNPEFRQRLAVLDTQPLDMSTPAFVDLLRREGEVWQPLVRQLGLKE